MTSTRCFIEPLDVLFLRGNKLFGDPGSFGESLIPPWPSVAAGALRSALLAHKEHDPARYARGEIDDAELGTPERPGTFTLTAFHLARRNSDGRVETLHALPADLVANTDKDDKLEVRHLVPHPKPAGILSSSVTPVLPVLAERERSKPVSGLWLNGEGWAAYLAGQPIDGEKHLVRNSDLWQIDTRVGVGLDPAQRRAADGKLFTVQAVVLCKREHEVGSEPGYDVGFAAEVSGAQLPGTLTLRLGGDGRSALACRLEHALSPEPNYQGIATAGRCRLVMTSPGLFAGGWLPTGTTPTSEREFRFDLHGVRGRLVCAAVPRAEVISGWDLAAWSQRKGGPKPAQRAVPTGSVYWLDELEATPEALRKLAQCGLWPESEDNKHRKAEGFNRLAIACWRNA